MIVIHTGNAGWREEHIIQLQGNAHALLLQGNCQPKQRLKQEAQFRLLNLLLGIHQVLEGEVVVLRVDIRFFVAGTHALL